MAEFKVGGKCICVESVSAKSSLGQVIEYKKGLTYTVKEITICNCNTLHLWLGDVLSKGAIKTCVCWRCKKKLAEEKAFVIARHFIPLDDFKEVTFTKINEEVPVSAQ